ncbi:hypothetical protein [Streptacidiphilus neutrinimicus]|uniref:hypothetical protein n=1 Tax=Streptacidiphilus neutrinimicus TaxID=105420 RepID=UPI0005AA499C|nr:hypothetical protein [Streptacidiphilus neutrinimicus]
MGIFDRAWRPDFTFDAVVADNIAYDAWTDEDGVVHLEDGYDPDLVIVPDGVLIGRKVYPAYLGDDGRIYMDEDRDSYYDD